MSMEILKKSIKWLAIILGITLALFFTYFISVFVSANSIKITEDVLSKNFFNLQVLDINGNAIEITNEYAKIEPYELNENVINAITSIEDKRFFEHNGIDILRIGKASINNALSLSFKEGASTITQQLIKNTLLSSEKTITRKIKEINLALRAEKTFSKEEILSLYLSAIYFGNGNNGLKEGAKYYFSKDIKDLNVLESATLAGIVKAPTAYSPISNPEKALERRNVVLKAMKDNNKITELEYEEYVKLPLSLNVSDKHQDNDYINYLLAEVEEVLKDENFTSKGYTVYSYYTPIKNSQTATNTQYNNTQLILGNDGEILYINESKNNSINKRGNVASLIKPLLYAVALDENVITPATYFKDAKISFGDYSPRNYKDVYYGDITLRTALTKGTNTTAVSTLNYLTLDKFATYAKKFGFEITEKDGLSVALGSFSKGITPLEIAKAYTVFSNDGEMLNCSTIKSIKDSTGNTIYEHTPSRTKIISKESAFIISDILKENSKTGTAKLLKDVKYPIYAKTGTNGNNEMNIDSYCLAFNNKYTALSYMYSDENSTLKSGVGGGTTPTVIVKELFDNLIIENNDNLEITKPQSVQLFEIDGYLAKKDKILALASVNIPKKYLFCEYFDVNKAPTEISTQFDNPIVEKAELKIVKDKVILNLDTKDIYHYDLYDDLSGEYISTIEGNGKTITLNINDNNYFYSRIKIIPYVKNKRFGNPYYTNLVFKF